MYTLNTTKIKESN